MTVVIFGATGVLGKGALVAVRPPIDISISRN
jgi:hypothetical protein